ncbi:MAG: hypothetical protein KC729_17535, partial [Candidatus Eisenbacteria bacterium]|nr:hypothetical protein [Candidatus Eisenbacteria bacterium]
HVVNYDVPYHAEDYVHRIGRTARAGRTGMAIMLATSRDRASLQAIERLLGGPLGSNGSGRPKRAAGGSANGSSGSGSNGNGATGSGRRRRGGRGRTRDAVPALAAASSENGSNGNGTNGNGAGSGRRNGSRRSKDASGSGAHERVPAVAHRGKSDTPRRRTGGESRRERIPAEPRTPTGAGRSDRESQPVGLFQSVLGRLFRR